jgi:2-phospho-L-lactate guanylyltransferase
MARDVRDAVLTCQGVEEIVVVTRDPLWRSLLGVRRLRFVADSPTDSLNDALRRGAATCETTRPGHGVAALTADLPALRPTELGLALGQADVASTFFVPDAHGDGTTLFAARSHAQFWPHYGVGSRARHIEAGALEVHRPELAGIRQDVDTVEDLERARALGLGHHTGAVMATILGLNPYPPSRAAAQPSDDVHALDDTAAKILDASDSEPPESAPSRRTWATGRNRRPGTGGTGTTHSAGRHQSHLAPPYLSDRRLK